MICVCNRCKKFLLYYKKISSTSTIYEKKLPEYEFSDQSYCYTKPSYYGGKETDGIVDLLELYKKAWFGATELGTDIYDIQKLGTMLLNKTL